MLVLIMRMTEADPIMPTYTRRCQRARLCLLFAVLLHASEALADNNHLPQPWRSDAVVYGSEEFLNTERFLHELSFAHSQKRPSLTDNGIRGTGGSIGSRRLYYDFRFRQDFGFNDNQQGFLLDVQRSEDFDGSYDRQLVGFRHQLTEATEIWLQGDVFADKSQTDIYFSSRHYTSRNSWLHGAWILPDAYFNDKTRSGDEFLEQPHSFFLQYHLDSESSALTTTTSINYSPTSTLDSRREGLVVTSESLRGAITQNYATEFWLLGWEISGERTRRDYQLDETPSSDTPFQRDAFQASATAQLRQHRLAPRLGVHFIAYKENGFLGRSLDQSADIRRLEPMLSGSLALQLAPGKIARPALYLSVPHIRQRYSREGRRDHSGFTGKLALPLEITLSAREQAVLTIAPTFYLHKAAFGGGNLQLHWPM